MKILHLLFLFCLLASCSTFSKKVELGGKDHQLTQAYAEARAQQVSDVDYSLTFDISEKKPSYKGRSQISFTPLHQKSDLRIDFYKGDIKKLSVNGKAIPIEYNGTYIRIPASTLVGKRVLIDIEFSHPFSTSGRGFHRAVDPKDGRIYVYTNLEPYDANQVFPCFDQPDLKATYEMKVKAPKKWKVITSVREKKREKVKKADTWVFPRSQRFSTYIWSLHAGDFHVWEDNKFRYPLRLFARRTLAKYVKPKQWFRYTRLGFDYFDDYFGVTYPYKKYDQVIVPEFFSGAMENVAAVTFNERFVSKGVKSRKLKRSLAVVIHHEMAHMWFGDLVTMKWWNDLWLNESFATYMSYKSAALTTEFKEVWRYFSQRKSRAIFEDELPTTHPIEGDVPDTFQARTNFDGISYGKGASVLKQINFLIGEESFKKGIRYYFKKYAVKNTELKDFVSALQTGTEFNLRKWQESWLQTAGVNTMTPQWTCESGKLKSLSIMQTYKEGYPFIRDHKSRLALIYKSKGALQLKKWDIRLNKKNNSIPIPAGTPCPQGIETNFESYAYLKTVIDKQSLKSITEILEANNETFLRQEYWGALWRMVRDGQLSVVAYADLLKRLYKKENDVLIVSFQMGTIDGVAQYLPKTSKVEKAFYQDFLTSMERQTWDKMISAPAGSELQKTLFSGFTGLARSSFGQKKAHDLLKGRKQIKGLKIDQDKRWSLLYSLSSHGNTSVEKLIKKELKKDASSKGKKSAMMARASFPKLSVKKKWYEQLLDAKKSSNFDEFRKISGSLFPDDQFDLHSQFSQNFYGDLKKVETHRNAHVARVFALLVPIECEPGRIAQTKAFIENENLRPGTAKSLKLKVSEAERCQMIRTRARKEGYKVSL